MSKSEIEESLSTDSKPYQLRSSGSLSSCYLSFRFAHSSLRPLPS